MTNDVVLAVAGPKRYLSAHAGRVGVVLDETTWQPAAWRPVAERLVTPG